MKVDKFFEKINKLGIVESSNIELNKDKSNKRINAFILSCDLRDKNKKRLLQETPDGLMMALHCEDFFVNPETPISIKFFFEEIRDQKFSINLKRLNHVLNLC